MRKVKFFFESVPESMQEGDKDLQEKAKERTGVFHSWGTDFINDGNDKAIIVSRAIVEEDVTKKVFLVYPEYVQFLD